MGKHLTMYSVRTFLSSALLWLVPAGLSTIAVTPERLGWTLVLAALLSLLSVIDFKTFRLPDVLTLSVAGIGAVMVWQLYPEDWPHHLVGGLLGYGLLFAIETGYLRLRGQAGLGRGDAKLLGALGVWIGWQGLAPSVLIASICGLTMALITQAFTNNSAARIAFGPWIALGGFMVWLARPWLAPLLGY